MGYTWDRTTRLYKTRKPVPGTNARPVEEYDEEEEEEDEDDEDEEENNEDNSQPMEHDQ